MEKRKASRQDRWSTSSSASKGLLDQGMAQRLTRREALLRLVDPAGLGGFCWLWFHRNCPTPAPRGPAGSGGASVAGSSTI